VSAPGPAVGRETDRRQVVAWGLWDWGSAAFNAVIVTFVFSVYLTDAVGDDLPGAVPASSWLGWALGAGGFVIAVLAPVTGRRADARGHRKRSLLGLTLAVVAITSAMFFVKDDYHYLWLGLLLISLGSVVFELASVPYYSMLRQVSTPATIGRVSGLGWAFGYLGGIVLLLFCYFGFVVGDGDTRGFFGVSTDDGFNIRLITLVGAAWFLLFALPLFFWVPELPADASPVPATLSVRESYAAVFRDVRRMWRDDRQTAVFLIASAFYRDGLTGVFTFGAVLAVSVYGIAEDDVLIFGVAANVVAAAGALAAGRLDDRLGPRFVIVVSICSMLVTATVLLFVDGTGAFWLFGLVLCLFVGPAQSASRTLMARLTPVGKEGEYFGLYAMTGRAVSFLAPALFGLFTFVLGDDRWGILGIMIVLAIGLAALLRVPSAVRDRALSPS
jgi:UMF1 family MFS transporter